MKTFFVKFWQIFSIGAIVTLGTILYNTGSRNTGVTYQLAQLSTLTNEIKCSVEGLSTSHNEVRDAVIELQTTTVVSNEKLNTKLNTIVINMPNNSDLIKQLYEIELAINRKNDTINMLTMKNQMLRKGLKINIEKVN